MELLYQGDKEMIEIIDICKKCLFETDLTLLTTHSKRLRDLMENLLFKTIGEERWIHYWWDLIKIRSC